MSRAWRKGKDKAPFEEWDGSNAAVYARQSYERRGGPAAPPTDLELERAIEEAVRRAKPAPRGLTGPLLPPVDPLRASLSQIRTVSDLMSIWSVAPAPHEPAAEDD